MPSIFRALASISVWILFIVGCSWLLVNLISWTAAEVGTTEDWQAGVAAEALGIAAIILSVVAMKLRKDLE